MHEANGCLRNIFDYRIQERIELRKLSVSAFLLFSRVAFDISYTLQLPALSRMYPPAKKTRDATSIPTSLLKFYQSVRTFPTLNKKPKNVDY